MSEHGPIRWTVNKASDEFNIDRRTLVKRLRAEAIEPGEDGRYFTSQIMIAVMGNLERERIREASANADLRELKRDILRQRLIPVETYRAALDEVGLAIRQTIEQSDLSAETKAKALAHLRKWKDVDFSKVLEKEANAPDEEDDEGEK